MDSLQETLAEEVLPDAPWEALAPHYARGVLVYVEGPSLAEAGVALARDDVTTVEKWLADGSMRRATDDDARQWAAAEPTFDILVIDPWVLIKLTTNGGAN